MNIGLSQEVETKLASQLQPDETVVWSYQPHYSDVQALTNVGGCIVPGVILPVLFLLSFVQATGWEPKRSLAVGAMAFAICIVSLLWRKRLQVSSRKCAIESAYVITNKRAIVFAGPGLMHTLQAEAQMWSFYPSDLMRRRVDTGRNGDGDIILWEKAWDMKTCADYPEYRRVGFLSLHHARHIDDLLEQLVANAPNDPDPGVKRPDSVSATSVGIRSDLIEKEREIVLLPASGPVFALILGILFMLVAVMLWVIGLNSLGTCDRMLAIGEEMDGGVRIIFLLIAPAFAWVGLIALRAGTSRKGIHTYK